MSVIGRSVPEWRGATPDTPVPLRVQMRILEREDCKCKGCTRAIRAGDRWVCDHIIALTNGGLNAERNLQPLCDWCAPRKDAADVALKAENYRIRVAHFGKRAPKGQPIPGSKRSRFKRRMDGTVEIRRGGEQ